MIKIPLKNGGVALVSDTDAERVKTFNWYRNKNKSTFYAVSYIKVNGKITPLYMHRFILNAPKGKSVDHENHDGLDNRRENIRICTISQNNFNSRSKKNTSGYRGVCFDRRIKGARRWKSSIGYQNKNIHIGYFLTPKEAARAYNAKARELFGDFARLNPV